MSDCKNWGQNQIVISVSTWVVFLLLFITSWLNYALFSLSFFFIFPSVAAGKSTQRTIDDEKCGCTMWFSRCEIKRVMACMLDEKMKSRIGIIYNGKIITQFRNLFLHHWSIFDDFFSFHMMEKTIREEDGSTLFRSLHSKRGIKTPFFFLYKNVTRTNEWCNLIQLAFSLSLSLFYYIKNCEKKLEYQACVSFKICEWRVKKRKSLRKFFTWPRHYKTQRRGKRVRAWSEQLSSGNEALEVWIKAKNRKPAK